MLGVRLERNEAHRRGVLAGTLAILFLVSLLNYLDRFVLGILLPAIKRDLAMSDTELGFVAGGAVTIFYVLAGVPIGRWADRRPRRVVIGASVAAWSAMTVVCGVAQDFQQLAIARVLVGVGAAGATAPAAALISDLFAPRSRAGALSVYSMGLPAGVLAGFAIGGMIAERVGWRATLIGFGLAGLALAGLVLLALPQAPPDRDSEEFTTADTPLRSVLIRLMRRPEFIHICVGSGLFTVLWLGLLNWLPTYFVREYGMSIASVSWRLAFILGFSQLFGLLVGGLAADRLGQRDRRMIFWLCAASSVTPLPFVAVAMLWPSPGVPFVALIPVFGLGLLQGAPAMAAVQMVARADERAVTTSLYLLIVNLIGGAGAQAIGVLSDRLTPALHAGALGTSLLVIGCVAGTWSAIHFMLAARALGAAREPGASGT